MQILCSNAFSQHSGCLWSRSLAVQNYLRLYFALLFCLLLLAPRSTRSHTFYMFWAFISSPIWPTEQCTHCNLQCYSINWNNWIVLDLSLLRKVLHGTREEQTPPPVRTTLGNQGNHRPAGFPRWPLSMVVPWSIHAATIGNKSRLEPSILFV